MINFDYHFGDTNSGRKYLNIIPEITIERSSSFGINKYQVNPRYICRRRRKFKGGLAPEVANIQWNKRLAR